MPKARIILKYELEIDDIQQDDALMNKSLKQLEKMLEDGQS